MAETLKCPSCGATETETKGFDKTCSYCGHIFKSEETKDASGNAHEAIKEIEDLLTKLKTWSFPSFFEKLIYCFTLGIFYFMRKMMKKPFHTLTADLEQKLKHLKTYHSDNKKVMLIHEEATNTLADFKSGYIKKKSFNFIMNIIVGVVFVVILTIIFI
jgi:rubredoxin